MNCLVTPRARSLARIAAALAAALASVGCGSGSKSPNFTYNPPSESPNRAATLAKFDVDVASGKVRITPGKQDARSRAVLNGAAIAFTSSDLLSVPGDSGQRLLQVAFANNSGQTLGNNARLVIGSLSNSSAINYKSQTTVAAFLGSGSAGSADGIGTAATFSGPTDVVAGQGPLAGSFFVADSANHVIRQIRPDGSVTTFAGTAGSASFADGIGTVARFNNPQQIACDGNGNLFVADAGNNRVRFISPVGQVNTISGDGTAGNNDDVVGPPALTATHNSPKGIAVSADGNRVYVADASNHSIRLITYVGTDRTSVYAYTTTTIIGNATIDGTPRAPVSGTNDGSHTGSGIADGKLNSPVRLALITDSSGIETLYVADNANHAIRRIDSPSDTANAYIRTAVGTTGTAGTADGNGSVATVTKPNGLAYLAVDSSHFALFFTEEDSTTTHRLREVLFTAPGNTAVSKANYEVVTLAGGASGYVNGDGNSALFSGPSGLCVVGGSGGASLLLADKTNNRIRKVTLSAQALKSGGTLSSVTEPVRLVNADGEIPNQTAWFKKLSMSQTADLQFYVPSGVAGFTFTVYLEGDTNVVNLPANGSSYLSTLAGDGIAGSTNGPGKVAQAYNPYGIAAVPTALQGTYGLGSVRAFWSDALNHRIRYIDAEGNVGTFAGNVSGSADGAGTAASFNRPWGIAIHPDGSLFVCDSLNRTIRRVSTSGAVTTIAGTVGSSGTTDGAGNVALLNTPEGITVDAGGTIYFTDNGAHTVRRIEQTSGDPSLAPSYQVTTVAGSPGTPGTADGTGASAGFNFPAGIVADSDGKLFVADSSNGRIRQLVRATSTTMTVSTIVSGLSFPTGVTLDSAHNIYYAEYSANKVSRVHPANTTPVVIMGSTAGGTDGSAGKFSGPRHLTVEPSGNILVSDYGNHRIRVIHRTISDAQAASASP